MSDADPPPGTPGTPDPGPPDPTPITPGGPWQQGTRVEQLATWIVANRPWYTDAALERSALAGGFTADEFQQAQALADAGQRQAEAIGPVRSMASRIVLAAYGVVWLLFAIPFLLRAQSTYDFGPILQAVLTVSLLIGLTISWLVMRALHPDPAHTGRALTILLVVPVILLLVIGGLCLPFVPATGA